MVTARGHFYLATSAYHVARAILVGANKRAAALDAPILRPRLGVERTPLGPCVLRATLPCAAS